MEDADAARSSLILVREWEQQMSSSSCCGSLEGDLLEWGGERCFPERRRHMERAGELYREARRRFGADVEIHVVDPRNLVSLLPILVREFRRHRVSFGDALRTLFGLRVNAVVLNGRLVGSEKAPTRDPWPELP